MSDPIFDDPWDRDLSPVQRWRARWADRAELIAHTGSAATRRAAATSLRQGFVVTVGQARTAGLSSAELRSLVRRRSWSRPRWGSLAPIDAHADRLDRAALAATAAALVRSGAVISHESAAILHGLPVLTDPVSAILTIGPGAPRGRSGVVLHQTQLEDDELTKWYGAPTTTVARTVTDIARASRSAGLVTADAAVREGLVVSSDLHASAARCAGWPGNTAARWVADQADGLAESPLESLTRECVLIHGLPRPVLQAVLVAPTGQRDRVDFCWREQRVVLEADGQLKYRTDGSALWREKRRQERIEQQGYRVVRVSWREVVYEPGRTVARIAAALTWQQRPS